MDSDTDSAMTQSGMTFFFLSFFWTRMPFCECGIPYALCQGLDHPPELYNSNVCPFLGIQADLRTRVRNAI